MSEARLAWRQQHNIIMFRPVPSTFIPGLLWAGHHRADILDCPSFVIIKSVLYSVPEVLTEVSDKSKNLLIISNISFRWVIFSNISFRWIIFSNISFRWDELRLWNKHKTEQSSNAKISNLQKSQFLFCFGKFESVHVSGRDVNVRLVDSEWFHSASSYQVSQHPLCIY